MKKLILTVILGLTVVSCKTSSHTSCDAYSEVQVQENTGREEIMKSQRALAIYIQSLPEKEKQEWINGTFTEEEKNEFIESIEKN